MKFITGGRFEVYEVTYDEHNQPSYKAVGKPHNTFDDARKVADGLVYWEIVEVMRRMVDFRDRVPDKVQKFKLNW